MPLDCFPVRLGEAVQRAGVLLLLYFPIFMSTAPLYVQGMKAPPPPLPPQRASGRKLCAERTAPTSRSGPADSLPSACAAPISYLHTDAPEVSERAGWKQEEEWSMGPWLLNCEAHFSTSEE